MDFSGGTRDRRLCRVLRSGTRFVRGICGGPLLDRRGVVSDAGLWTMGLGFGEVYGIRAIPPVDGLSLELIQTGVRVRAVLCTRSPQDQEGVLILESGRVCEGQLLPAELRVVPSQTTIHEFKRRDTVSGRRPDVRSCAGRFRWISSGSVLAGCLRLASPQAGGADRPVLFPQPRAPQGRRLHELRL